MSCSTKLVADIVNSCRSVKGLKPKAWVFNNGDFTLTKTNNVLSGIVKIGSVTAFTLEGFKDFMNAGYEAVIAENMPTVYKHKLTVNATSATAAEKANVDKADNIFVVVQANDSTFLAYGINQGIWKSAQTKMANDNNALTAIEFGSRAGMEEEYSEYIFATGGTAAQDLAYLVALES
jgi:hypothetical protein